MSEELVEELIKDVRVIALILLVLGSIVSIYMYPMPPPGSGFRGNLKFGLDLEGGSWIQLQLKGTLVQIDASKEKIIENELGKKLNDFYITDSDENQVTFTTTSSTTKEFIDSLGYETSDVTIRGNVTQVTIYARKEGIISTFLSKKLDEDVVPTIYEDKPIYEIRAKVPKERIDEILSAVGGKIALGENGDPIYMNIVTKETMELTKSILDEKLNILGLSDIPIRTVGDDFILIDLAGVDLDTAKRIVGHPGKFEIRIQTTQNNSEHVLFGDDIDNVDPMPVAISDGLGGYSWAAAFRLTETGAKAFRDAAIRYGAVDDPDSHYVMMLLDDNVIYTAPLSPDFANNLKEYPIYYISATTGSGDWGKQEAEELIIHLSAGALPVSVETVGSGQVPALLGAQFREQVLIAAVLAIIVVSIVVSLRYHQRKIILPMLITSLSEVIILLGFASLINWQLNLPSIAGILAVIGTGIDHLVVITDEVLFEGEIPPDKVFSARLSSAFKIILAAAATTVFAMLPLYFLGLGALAGFAMVTIVGVLVGVFVTRPAYGRIIKAI